MNIHIESVQYTPGIPHVHIQYAIVGATNGPLAGTKTCSTTQEALSALGSAGDGYWSDEEVIATVEAEMTSVGLAATVLLPEPPAPPAEEA